MSPIGSCVPIASKSELEPRADWLRKLRHVTEDDDIRDILTNTKPLHERLRDAQARVPAVQDRAQGNQAAVERAQQPGQVLSQHRGRGLSGGSSASSLPSPPSPTTSEITSLAWDPLDTLEAVSKPMNDSTKRPVNTAFVPLRIRPAKNARSDPCEAHEAPPYASALARLGPGA